MNRLKIVLTLLAAITVLGACSNDDEGRRGFIPNEQLRPLTANNRVIYQINVYSYSAEGNFKGVEKDLRRLHELGVDILWLMPVHPIGEENRQGTLGSPYGVRDYKALNPDFGTEADFKSLIDAAHKLGMEIWMDWVANHTAWDNIWVEDHLDYYAEKDGQRPYAPPGWPDVIQLDHTNPQMRHAMADAMIYWIRDFGVDGFRFDAADFVPLDFWRELRTEVDAAKKVTWLSEGSDPDYMAVFDYDYAWQFGEELMTFGRDGDMAKLVEACKDLYRDPAYRNKGRMVYITNHDLNAYNGTEIDKYGNNVMALTVLSFTIFDLPLIFDGQEIGMDKSINFAEPDKIPWELTNRQYVNLHKRLTHLKRTQPALEDGTNRGSLTIHETTQENVLAYSRTRDDNQVLVILNLGNYATRVHFKGDGPKGKFTDYFDGSAAYPGGDSGVALAENGYAVFVK